MNETDYVATDGIYWASEPTDEDPDKIASAIEHKWRRYQERIRVDGRVDVWRTSDRCYHGRNPDGSYANSVAIVFGGESGEVAQIHVGAFRRHVAGMLALATSQRPAIEVTATSNDPEAVASTQVGRQVIDYDLDEGLEEELASTHERALLYAEGYLVQTWDPYAGDLVGTEVLAPDLVDGGEDGIPEGDEAQVMGAEIPVYEGGVRVDVRSPLDVARDLDLDRCTDMPWYIVRTRVHRWELAARYPEDAEKRKAILEAADADDDEYHLQERVTSDSESDYVHMLTLYHMKTAALPAGRIVEVVNGTALYDGEYPYDHCVVHRDVPTPELDRAVGYGAVWDMLAVSQALDAIESGVLSVADAGWAVNYLAARGQGVDSKMLDGGMRFVEYDPDGMGGPPPALMDRPEVREMDLKMSEHYQTLMRVLSGQNAVVQGDPDANIKSGNFAALVASMAVQAINREAAAYAALMRSTTSGRIRLYQAFATTPRLIEISGRDKTGHVTEFSQESLRGVRRVKVELENPIMRTLQGKSDLADKMLERYGPAVISPDRFFALLKTGRLDDIDNLEVEHRVIARKENDLFREGEAMVIALITDHHACHIREHLRQLNDASVRLAPNAVQQIQALSQHITMHATLWAQMPPALLTATKQEAVPPPMMPGMGMPANDNGAPPPAGGGGGEPVVPGMPPALSPPDVANDNGSQPGMPSMPGNPITGERTIPGMT